MERRDLDRVPRGETFWFETIQRWQDEGLRGGPREVLELLGSDFRQCCWLFPAPFPGEQSTIEQDERTRIVRDEFGKRVRYWRERSGTPEHLGFECDSREAWETRFKPALLSAGLQVNVPEVVRRYRRGRAEGKWCHLDGIESFEALRALIGDEISLMAMLDDPEWIVDVSRTFTDLMLQNLDAIMATGIQPDGLWIYGDMAFRTATMCSPQTYRELIWPDHKRLADWAHAHRMKFIFHTDGDVNGVMDMYCEAGFDCIQPLEAKASMDVRKLLPRYHHRLAFFGNIDVMAMATNDMALIEQEIASKLAVGKQYRSYIYHSDHSVPPSVSWQTYQGIVQLLDKYGNYD